MEVPAVTLENCHALMTIILVKNFWTLGFEQTPCLEQVEELSSIRASLECLWAVVAVSLCTSE